MSNKKQTRIDDIFLQNYARLKAYACRFVGMGNAEDIVQDVFLSLLDNYEAYSFDEDIAPLLYRMVHNRCLNMLRHNNTINEYSEAIEKEFLELEIRYTFSHESEIEKKIFREELNSKIKKEIDELPEKCRHVFILSYMNHMKTKEIAELLNITKSTVDNHLYNALCSIRKRIQLD